MASAGYITSCVDRSGVRVGLPESNADFVRLVGSKLANINSNTTTNTTLLRANSSNNNNNNNNGYCYYYYYKEQQQPRVVDIVSCRQMFLRSYTFSRKNESFSEKTKKRLARSSLRILNLFRRGIRRRRMRKRECLVAVKRAKQVSCAAFLSMFRRLAFCTTITTTTAAA